MKQKVLIKLWEKQKGFYSDYIHPGIFHQWGLAVIESTDSINSYSIALVEMGDGTIVQVLPEHIKFIQKEE
jgi:hypothetical protein